MLKSFNSLYVTLAVVILATALLQIVNGYLNGVLSYHRVNFINCIYCEWITPSLVHFNWMHWFFNILNFIAIVVIFNKIWSSKKLLTIFAISSAFIMVNLYIFNPNIKSYVGMSGVLYSLAMYGALQNLKYDKLVSLLILFYVILKLFFGNSINHLIGVDIALSNLNIVKEVHWYGAIIGILIFLNNKLIIKLD